MSTSRVSIFFRVAEAGDGRARRLHITPKRHNQVDALATFMLQHTSGFLLSGRIIAATSCQLELA